MNLKGLQGDAVLAKDGEIGPVRDAYFDDERWALRYLVVEAEHWMPRRTVLISPASLEREPADAHTLRVALTCDEVKRSPDADTCKPVSRQYEMAHARHFGYPYYWLGPDLWGNSQVPMSVAAARKQGASALRELQEHAAEERDAADSHLRSSAEVIGYAIEASDGLIGHVEDFLVDESSWAVSGMIVDTRNWLPGGKVVLPPSAVADIDWQGKTVRVRLTREEIKSSSAA